MSGYLHRMGIYLKEMYPPLPRLALGYIIAFEIYFIVLLNQGADAVSLGWQEAVLGFTVASFLCWLRMADDLKDYRTDCRLFPARPLPSGRVKRRDLAVSSALLIAFTLSLNVLVMPRRHVVFCLILYTYGSLMAVWFFQKHKIQPSLPMALVTHNPVQLILNLYVIAFVIVKYGLRPVTLCNVMAVFTLYFPALIWEISRKIRAPSEETEYVTYSKLFGYRAAVDFVHILTWVDIVTNLILVWRLSLLSGAALLVNAGWMAAQFRRYKTCPTAFRLVDRVERYTYIQETLMLLTVALYILRCGVPLTWG